MNASLGDLLAADPVAAVESAATAEHRSPRERVGEAVERYLQLRKGAALNAVQIAERLLP